MASSNAARRLPSESGPAVAQQGVIKKGPHRFQPGESGNPKGRPAGTSREQVVKSFFEMLSKKAQGSDVPYLEIMMQKVLNSEHLLSKFIDKLLPNMTTDQTTNVFNNFESVLAQVNAQRAALSFSQSPGLPAPVPAQVVEPELEPIIRKDGGT